MLPKFELAPILIYLVMLPKTLRPSITPSPSTARLFSSKMMSAKSWRCHRALSTDMPTSAAARRAIVDAVAEKSNDVALPVQGSIIAAF